MAALSRIRSFIFILFIFPIMTTIFTTIGVSWYLLTRKRILIDLFSHIWAKTTLFFLGVHLVVKGKENIPSNTGYLVLFNHKSFLDIFILFSQIKSLRFGAKIELFSIPIFNWGMKASGVLPIARQNRENAIQVLKEAENRARNGEAFALSPEGGRNVNKGLLPFKSGPFIFAINTGIPIVPVVIHNADVIWPKGTFFPGRKSWLSTVEVEFLPVVTTEKYTLDERSILSDVVYKVMNAKVLVNGIRE